MDNPICIYHSNCADGFGAAWAVRHGYAHDPELSRLRPPEYVAGVYQTEPPDCTGRNVLFVDFCYKRPVMEGIAKVAKRVLILDHHKSAYEDCGDLGADFENVTAVFDMGRSGAMIAWAWANDGAKPPMLIEHIQDRDLWKFELDKTKEIQAAVFSYPYEFEVWDGLMRNEGISRLATEGAAIHRKHMKDIAELVDVLKRPMTIGGYQIPAMSVPYMMVSEAGHIMAVGQPFAACYWDSEDNRTFGLRSTDQGVDVSEIALKYGGGGHRNAAGFAVPRDHELARA